MGATVETARGPIEEVTHIRYGMSPQAARAERIEAMDQVMSGLESVLAEPVYEGDIQTALIHNRGRAAFGHSGTGNESARDYIRLSGAIDADAGDDGSTPVLLVSQVRNGEGRNNNTETALVMVDSDKATFRSSMVHERHVRRAGYAGKIAITRRSLSLLGDSSTIHADISGYGNDYMEINPHAKKQTKDTELVLDERSVIDGKNGSKPVPVSSVDITRNIDRMWAGPTYLVGWKAIGDALAARIYDHTRGYHAHGRHDGDHKPQEVFPYALSLREFLESTGHLEALLRHNNPLKKMFEQAVSLNNSISALAPPTEHEDED